MVNSQQNTLPGFLKPSVNVLAAASTVAASLPTVLPPILAFTMQRQLQSNWCWAAVTASVATFYDDRIDQCAVVATYRPHDVDCSKPLPPYSNSGPGNQPFELKSALDDFGHWHPPILSPPPFADIVGQIAAARPVCCHLNTGNGDSGHFVVITGCGDGERVYINDPDPSQSHAGWKSYGPLCSGAGGPLDQVYYTQ